MSTQGLSPTTPVETPMDVDGTLSLTNLTSVIHYALAVQYAILPIVLRFSHFDGPSTHAEQVPAYDQSAFVAKVTGAAAKVSHLDPLFRILKNTMQKWLQTKLADTSG